MRALSITQIKRRNAAAGLCYFSPASMRYWSSRTYTTTAACATSGDTLFITSETAHPTKPETRRYTIRRFENSTCDVWNASGPMEYDDLNEAIQEMRQLAKTL